MQVKVDKKPTPLSNARSRWLKSLFFCVCIARLRITLISGLLLLVTGWALLMSAIGRNASRDGLVKIGWVVYSLLLPCIFSLSLINCLCLFCLYAALPIRCKDHRLI